MKKKFVRLTKCNQRHNRRYIGQVAMVLEENCTSADGHSCAWVRTADGKYHSWAIGNFEECCSENLILFRKSA